MIASQEDLKEVKRLEQTYQIPKEIIYLMPEGVTHEALREKSQWLIEVCKKEGYRFSSRLQIEVYGDVRGT